MFHRVHQQPEVSIYPFQLITITCCPENLLRHLQISLLRKHEVYDQYSKRFSTSKASHAFSKNIVVEGAGMISHQKTKATLLFSTLIPSSPAIESQLIFGSTGLSSSSNLTYIFRSEQCGCRGSTVASSWF